MPGSKLHKPFCRRVIAQLLSDGAPRRLSDIRAACEGYSPHTVRDTVSLMGQDGTLVRIDVATYQLNPAKEVSRG